MQLQTVPDTQSYPCTLLSAPLEYKLIGCDKCGLRGLIVKNIIRNETKFCSFDIEFSLDNTSGEVLYTTIGSLQDSVIVSPSVVVLHPGVNAFTVMMIPINGFNGGLLNIFFTATDKEGKQCMEEIHFDLPACTDGEGGGMVSKVNATVPNDGSSITLHPNPAKEEVTITYSDLELTTSVEIYDLMGRSLSQQSIRNTSGSLTISLNNYPSGIYIMVFRSEKGIITQKKLIKE